MELIITIIHIVVCILLVVVVLLQTGKGAEVGAVMGGGGSQALFGGAGSGNFLSKLTVYAGVAFMITSIGLTILSRSGGSGSIMDDMPDPEPAAEQPFAADTTESSTSTTEAIDSEGAAQ